MKIQSGGFVKIRPSTCAYINSMGMRMTLDPERAYRVLRVVRDVVRRGSLAWVHTEMPGGDHGAYWCHNIEECIAVPEPVPPKRYPVDRVAVLLRLRRDFCLKWGRYPTINLEARQEAREMARLWLVFDRLCSKLDNLPQPREYLFVDTSHDRVSLVSPKSP